jgi:putative aldouronate transport system permease protein
MGAEEKTVRAEKSVLQRGSGFFQNYWRHRDLVLLALPALLILIIFRYVPMYGVTLAFKDFSLKLGVLGSPWVGLKHFQLFFSSEQALRVTRNTLIISTLKWVTGVPATIMFALLINEVRSTWFKKTAQSISYLPHFLSWVIVAGIIREITSPTIGLFGYVADLLNINYNGVLSRPGPWLGTIVGSALWQGVGWGSIIYLAAMANIDPELYEAATVDGAQRLRQIWHITIPGIMPVATILIILSLSGILDAGFEQIFNLYHPLVYDVGDIIDTYVYRIGLLQFDFSFATAVGFFKNVAAFLLVLGANEIAKRYSDYAIWPKGAKK